MKYEPINFSDKFSQFSDRWSPKIIAQMNDYHYWRSSRSGVYSLK